MKKSKKLEPKSLKKWDEKASSELKSRNTEAIFWENSAEFI